MYMYLFLDFLCKKILKVRMFPGKTLNITKQFLFNQEGFVVVVVVFL